MTFTPRENSIKKARLSFWRNLLTGFKKQPIIAVAIIVTATFSVFTLSAMIWLNTSHGRDFIAAELSRSLSDENQVLQIEAITGNLYGDMNISAITLQDRKGSFLTVQNMTVRWRPMSLLSGVVLIDDILVEAINYSRNPVSDPSAETQSSSNLDSGNLTLDPSQYLPNLPVALRVTNFSVTNLSAPPLFSNKASLSMNGSLDLGVKQRIELDITAFERQQATSQAAAKITIAFKGNIAASAVIRAQKNSWLAELINQPSSYHDFSFKVSGDSFASLDGPIHYQKDNLQILDGSIASTHNSLSLTATIGNDPLIKPFLQNYTDFLSTETDLKLVLTEQEDKGFNADIHAVSSDTVIDLRADLGSINAIKIDNIRFKASKNSFIFDTGPETQITPVISNSDDQNLREDSIQTAKKSAQKQAANFENLQITGDIQPDQTGKWRISSTAEVERITFQDHRTKDTQLSLTGYIDENLTLESSLKISTNIETVWASSKDITLSGKVFAQQELKTWLFESITLKTGQSSVLVNGGYQMETKAADLAANIVIDASDIPPAYAPAALDHLNSGQIRAILTLDKKSNEIPLSLSLEGYGDQLDLKNPKISDLIGVKPTFATKAIASIKTGKIDFKSALSLAGVSVDTAGLITDLANVDVDYSINVKGSALKNFQPDLDLAGKTRLVGKLTGPVGDPSFSLTTEISQVILDKVEIKDIAVRSKIDTFITNPKGYFTVTAKAAAGPLNLHVDLSRPEGSLIALQNILFDIGPFSASGGLYVQNTGIVAGNIEAFMDAKSDPARDISGMIDADLSFGDQNGNQLIKANISGKDIDILINEFDRFTVDSLSIKGEGQANLKDLSYTLSSDIQDLGYSLIFIETLSLSGSGTDKKGDLSFDFDGLLYQPLSFKGRINYDKTPLASSDQINTEIRFQTSGSIAGTAISTPSPINLTMAERSVFLPRSVIKIGDGELVFSLENTSLGNKILLSADQIPLDFVAAIIPDFPLTGKINAGLDLSGPSDGLIGALNLNSDDIVLTKKEFSGGEDAFQVTALATFTKKGIDASAELKRNKTQLSNFKAFINIPAHLPWEADLLKADFILDGNFKLEGSLKRLWLIVGIEGHEFEGQSDIDMHVAGPLKDPIINGEAHLYQGQYENIALGLKMTNIKATTKIDNNRLVISRFEAVDGRGGSATLTGNIDLDPLLGFPGDLTLKMDKLAALRRPDARVQASADITFKWDKSAGALKGSVTVDQADLQLVTPTAQGVEEIAVTEINKAAINRIDQAIDSQDKPVRSLPITLDLSLKAPGQLFIRGRGLNAEGSGNFDIKGTSEAPLIKGVARLIRGDLEFAGKKFTLERGRIELDGSLTPDPVLDLLAVYKTPTLIADLSLTGTLSRPSLEMSSKPSYPDDEILSRILFGSSVTELSALEAIQLASAINDLQNGSGAGFIDRSRRLAGLDRLSFDKDESGNGTSITGGRYLTDNVYVELSTSTGGGGTTGRIEIDLTDNLALATRLSQSLDNNLSIRWKWRFN